MFFTPAAALLSIVAIAVAQTSVPGDLSSSFDPDALTIQVLYPALVKIEQHGIEDGSEVAQKDVSKAPSFALGDSSSVSTQLEMVIMFLDTTSSSQRMLHFLQTGFTANQDATAISSNDKPLVPYAAPGTLGEPSGKRQYSWLAFQQPKNFNPSSTLGAGDFDVQSFIESNNLDGALAGIGMFVNVNGLTGSGSGSSSTQVAQSTPQQPTSAATTSVAPLITINAASSTSSIQAPTFSFDTEAAAATTTSSSTLSSSSSTTTADSSTSTTMMTSVSSSTSMTGTSASASVSSTPSSAASALKARGHERVSIMALPIALAVAVGLFV